MTIRIEPCASSSCFADGHPLRRQVDSPKQRDASRMRAHGSHLGSTGTL